MQMFLYMESVTTGKPFVQYIHNMIVTLVVVDAGQYDNVTSFLSYKLFCEN